MSTRTGLRVLIRAELNDAGGVPLWTDPLLNEWIAEGIRDYSRNLPKEATQSIVTVAAQADYSLSTDCQRVVRVEHPTDFFRVFDPLSAGDVADPLNVPRTVAVQLTYDVWGPLGGRTLTLRPAPDKAGETIKVRYLALYAEPAADGTRWRRRARTMTCWCGSSATGRCSGSGRTRVSGSAGSGSGVSRPSARPGSTSGTIARRCGGGREELRREG